MDSNKAEYKRLGDYIREVDVRNRNLEVTKLMGINIGKYFMPSVANVIGTDLSNYKIVEKGLFACNLMHVGRDEKMPIALLDTNEPIIVSPAYWVFGISDTTQLLPAYLMLWFRRNEFDRNTWFYTDNDVRGGMSKEALMDMALPIPPIEQQQKIVSEYEAVTHRIHLNEQIIAKLEETAQALYRKMFVDEIDKEHLPEGWRIGTLGDYVELSQGIQVEIEKQSLVKLKGYNRFIRIIDYTPNSSEPPRYVNIVNKRYFCTVNDIVVIRYGDAGTICRRLEGVIANNLFKVSIIRKLTHNYLYYFLKSEQVQRQIKNSAASSTMPAITHSAIKDLDCLIPPFDIIKSFDDKANIVEKEILFLQNEICKLKELQSLLLAKIGK
ncbi:MAG: restriction endonuclease subunit S [Candidatus Onthomorpha sp.]